MDEAQVEFGMAEIQFDSIVHRHWPKSWTVESTLFPFFETLKRLL
jgi:hypothetical protein